MTKLNKIAEGHYVSDDGKVEITEYDGQYLVNELQGNRYVTVARAKTVGDANEEATKVLKAQPEPQQGDENTEVVETTTAQIAGASGATAAQGAEEAENE